MKNNNLTEKEQQANKKELTEQEKTLRSLNQSMKRMERYLKNMENFIQTRVTEDWDNTEERWITCEAYPLYMFCTTGEIFSARGNRILTPYSAGERKKNEDGTTSPKRLAVGIYDLDGIRRRKQLPWVLVEAFAQFFDIDNWADIVEIHHKDGNPLNNNLDNLRPSTSADHSYIHKLKRELNKTQKRVAELLAEYKNHE